MKHTPKTIRVSLIVSCRVGQCERRNSAYVSRAKRTGPASRNGLNLPSADRFLEDRLPDRFATAMNLFANASRGARYAGGTNGNICSIPTYPYRSGGFWLWRNCAGCIPRTPELLPTDRLSQALTTTPTLHKQDGPLRTALGIMS